MEITIDSSSSSSGSGGFYGTQGLQMQQNERKFCKLFLKFQFHLNVSTPREYNKFPFPA